MKKITLHFIFLSLLVFFSSCKKSNPAEAGTANLSEITILNQAATKKMAMDNIGDVHVHMEYQSPRVESRELFGNLIPWNKIWMIGANQPTTIHLPADMLISGKQVSQGQYALYAIPAPETWTFILNKNISLPYDSQMDVLSWQVNPEFSEISENLTFQVLSNNDSENGATEETGFISFAWGKVKIVFPVEQIPNAGSPRRESKATVGNSTVTVNYGSPAVRGREIWGALVPDEKIWVTGAYTATNIEFTQDIIISGKEIKAGKYAFFTIPNKKNAWTFILNTQWDQHLADKYDENKDVLRWEASPVWHTHTERLTYTIIPKTKENLASAIITMAWETLKISFEVAVK